MFNIFNLFKKNEIKLTKPQRKILNVLKIYTFGLCVKEMSIITGMSYRSVANRLCELKTLGVIYKKGNIKIENKTYCLYRVK